LVVSACKLRCCARKQKNCNVSRSKESFTIDVEKYWVVFMQFYEGDHAYEVERILDPATQLYSGWRYNVYRVRPSHELLRSGEAPTREEAEKAGKRALAEVIRVEHKRKTAKSKRAA
jgi:hypothetical protein